LEVIVVNGVFELFFKFGNGGEPGLDNVVMDFGEIFLSLGKLT